MVTSSLTPAAVIALLGIAGAFARWFLAISPDPLSIRPPARRAILAHLSPSRPAPRL